MLSVIRRRWLQRHSAERSGRQPPTRRSRPSVERLETRDLLSAWTNFGGNAQHTAISSVAAQPMDAIHWQTSIDLKPGRAEHYGEPVFTPSNTAIVPVKTNSPPAFQLEGINGANGNMLWTAATDYTEPPYDWLPPYQAVFDPVTNRAYFAGNGGTIYYVNNPDSPGATISGQMAFYGLSNYNANKSAYNSSVMIDTPLTIDSSGNVFFGFMVTGTNPSNLTGGGIARLSLDGTGTYVLAGSAAGDGNITRAALGSAPALSNDGSTVYVAVNNTSQNYAYLLGLSSTTLSTSYKVFLKDAASGNNAKVIDDSTAAPMVAPDGTVFFGVFGNPYNGSRGYLLHFSADLTHPYTPGAFGWDDTPSIIPTSMVPAYQGTSAYLILSKYNNYVAAEVGSSGGNGLNQVAILDPYASQPDPNNDGNPSLQVMAQVLTMASPTPDTQFTSSGFPDAVREWCTNGTAVDPATDSVFINNEDGNAYRWNLGSNTFTEAVQITNGVGEPYTPTAIAPDGTVYAINGGTLFALGGLPRYTLTNVSSLNPAVYGQAVTFTTTLASTSGGSVPTGTVTYKDGASFLATVTLSSGQASYTTSALAAAHHPITAAYSGDSNYSSGSTTLVQAVLEPTTTTLASSANPSAPGQAVTFTATVAITGPATTFTLTGTVTFKDGATTLGAGTLNSSGQATFTTSSLALGAHSIKAVYGGDANFNGSTSSSLAQTVLGAVVVDTASPGYSQTGTGWYTTIRTGYSAQPRADAPGNGSDTATWQVSASGYFTLQATWNPYSDRAPNAAFQIYDGTTLLKTVVVNQTQNPAGSTTVNGWVFQDLATLQFTSGTVKVVLSNNASGYVVADAVRFASQPAPVIDLNWSGGGITGPTSTDTASTFTISRTYNITGAPAPSNFTIGYYASVDNIFGGSDDILLGTETISAAADKAIGTHAGASPALQFPAGGTYYLFAHLDDGNAILETDKTNNVAQAPQQINVTVATPVIVSTADPGYSEIGTGWYSTVRTGYSAHPRADAPGTGSDKATWQVSGFAPGYITLQATWNPYSDRAPNAAFQIYDGTTLLQTVIVNQTQNPTGSTTVNGWVFQNLATLRFTSGTVRVVLSNNASGYVVADAVRMAPLPAPVVDLNWTGGGITAPASTDTASTFTINRTYNITGAAAPSSFTIGYYASVDNVFGGSDDFLLGTETISAAADESVGTHAGTSPPLQFPTGGTYYLFAHLDDGNAILETDKTNNTAQAPQQISVTVATPIIVPSGGLGYSETGSGWYTTVRTGYSAHPRADAPGTGSDTAAWQVSGWAPGNVTVQATWNPYSDRAPNAAFQIYDGTTLLKTVVLNQTQNPAGNTTINGWVFQDLATLQFTSGTIRVVLSNNASGYVVADTVRFVTPGDAAFPYTTSSIGVFSDQMPGGLSNNLVQFIATHMAGAQKMVSSETGQYRAVNPQWMELHYRLATESGPVPYIHMNVFSSDWTAVTSHEDWFMHNASNQRLSNSSNNWYLHDITNPGFLQYWVNSVIADMRAEGSQGVFADSFEAGVGGFWFDQYDVRFAGTNAGNPAYWPNGQTWMILRQNLINTVEAAFAATPEHFLYIPNIDAQVTSWEQMDYSHADGAMLEGFGTWGGGYLTGGNPSDWTLSMNRALALSRQDKALIMQPTLFSEPDAGNSPLEREFLMGTYLLLKGNHTYINILTPSGGINPYYYPEYQINLGAAITPLASDVSQYLWNGAYRRDFQNGIVLVNPTNSTLTINLPKTYQQVTGTGGGVLTNSSLDASGNYIGGALHYQSVSQVTLAPGSAAILLN